MRYYLIYDVARVIAIHKTKDSAISCYRHILRTMTFTIRLILKEVDSDPFGIIRSEKICLSNGISSVTICVESDDDDNDSKKKHNASFSVGAPFLT